MSMLLIIIIIVIVIKISLLECINNYTQPLVYTPQDTYLHQNINICIKLVFIFIYINMIYNNFC